MKTIQAAGQEAYELSNGEISLAVTVKGGHMAPVRFFADSDDPVEPYYLSPWQEENITIDGPELLDPLRGDFFCMPFGGDNVYGDERHPPHGEVSEKDWSPAGVGISADGRESSLNLELETKVRPGRVEKSIAIRSGEPCLYISHRITGFAGPTSIAHHAIMRGDRTQYLSCPRLITGFSRTVMPEPGSGEYVGVPAGTFFEDLSRVPSVWKDPDVIDCSVFPLRKGYCDILQVFPEKPVDGTPQWFTSTVPSHGYLWYSLKDPDLLPSTLLWQEAYGRHASPWNGRNCCIGIEETLAHAESGLKVSVEPNVLSERGFPTSIILDGGLLDVRNIQGVCRIPEGFDRVSGLTFNEDRVEFRSFSGKRASTPVDWSFVLEN